MSDSTTPTYRVEFGIVFADGRPVRHTPSGWDVKRAGKPTDENLALYVEALEASTRPGECNEHLGRTTVHTAQVVRQASGERVALYAPSPFRVV